MANSRVDSMLLHKCQDQLASLFVESLSREDLLIEDKLARIIRETCHLQFVLQETQLATARKALAV